MCIRDRGMATEELRSRWLSVHSIDHPMEPFPSVIGWIVVLMVIVTATGVATGSYPCSFVVSLHTLRTLNAWQSSSVQIKSIVMVWLFSHGQCMQLARLFSLLASWPALLFIFTVVTINLTWNANWKFRFTDSLSQLLFIFLFKSMAVSEDWILITLHLVVVASPSTTTMLNQLLIFSFFIYGQRACWTYKEMLNWIRTVYHGREYTCKEREWIRLMFPIIDIKSN